MKKQKVSGGELFKEAIVERVIEEMENSRHMKKLVFKALDVLDTSLDWGSWGGLEPCYECGDKEHKTDGGTKACNRCKYPVCKDCKCSCWRMKLMEELK